MVKDTLEEKIQEDKKSKNKKLPKEISQEILKKIFKNLLEAVGIMFYFIVLNLAYSTMKQERLIGDIEIFAGTFLVAGIIFLERAYKNDNDSLAVNGIEFLVLSLHSLSIMHVVTLFKYDFRFYLLTSSYIFSIYYVLKSIILYTKGRREYLNSLSDIPEIVKKDEPLKKEAKKRNSDEEIRRKQKEDIKSELTKEYKEPKKENHAKKKTTKDKKKTAKLNDNSLKEDKIENSTTDNKKKTKPKSKIEKEKIEEVKEPEKKKRGRPKKEVTKND